MRTRLRFLILYTHALGHPKTQNLFATEWENMCFISVCFKQTFCVIQTFIGRLVMPRFIIRPCHCCNTYACNSEACKATRNIIRATYNGAIAPGGAGVEIKWRRTKQVRRGCEPCERPHHPSTDITKFSLAL